MRRREFIAALGAAAAWPVVARAQQKPVPVIGLLGIGLAAANTATMAALRQGLADTGYVEGNNVAIEYRWAEGHYDRLPALAADLVGRKVDVILSTGGITGTLAAKDATSLIPIVFISGDDPVERGLVASLARPGGNLTGVSVLGVELMPKRLELLSEAVPLAKVIGMLVNPKNANAERMARDVQKAARQKGVQLHILKAGAENEINDAFAAIVDLQAGALIVGGDSLFTNQRDHLIALAARHAVPAIYDRREFTAAGGLLSYGPSVTGAMRQVGVYAGRILKGAQPADLPVEQPTTFELVVNLKTANALGLTIPPSILARADEVIES